ncbi:SDR family oxidoreductase [Zhihengliuella salsuginis]|nr:NAD(P)-dependent oxidoreductase [Zhihengliuella salsuginis]
MTENNPQNLAGRTLLMSGGSRGIGLAIALAAARRGANVALLAKTSEPHPKLEGTVHTAAAEVEAAGGRGLAVVGDVRNDDDVARAVQATVEAFGGIDVVVNNASAIDLSTTDAVDMKRYDLMQDINVRGTFLLSKLALEHLRESARQGRNPHILTLSPPIASGPGATLEPKWAGEHLAYTMAKYGMSLTTLGLAEELRGDGIGVNSLWPATLIDTAAIRALPGGEQMVQSARKPEIVADAAVEVLSRPGAGCTGNFFTDERVLAEAGIEDLARYGAGSGRLIPDIFL